MIPAIDAALLRDFSEHVGVRFDPARSHVRVFRIEFDQYRVAAQAIGDNARGAGAAERSLKGDVSLDLPNR